MKKLMIGCAQLPVHPQHIEKMEELGGLDDWDFIDKYIKQAGILNYDAKELPYDDESVEIIYSSHLLEHLGFKDAQSTLMEWKRVLKTGGILCLNVPDMEWACRAILVEGNNPEIVPDNFKESDLFNSQKMLMEVIYGNQDHEGEFHKSGYTVEILENLFKNIGFKNIEIEQKYEAHLMGCLIAKAIK